MDANTVSPFTPLPIAFQDGGHHVRAVVDEGKVVGILLMRQLLEQTAAGRDIHQLAARDVMQTEMVSTVESNNGLHMARLFQQHRMKSLVLTDSNGHFIRHIDAQEAIAGLPTSLFGFFQPVANIMIPNPKTTSSDMPLSQVIETWLLTPVSCLIVCDDAQKPIGMLSESDILNWILADMPADACVKDYMHAPVTHMPEKSLVYDVWDTMKQASVSKMVLVNAQGELSGLVTATDVLVALCRSQLDTFEQYHCPDGMDMALEWSKNGMIMAVKDSVVERFGLEREELVGLHWQDGLDKETVLQLLALKRDEEMEVLWEIGGAAWPFTATRDTEQAVMWWRLKI